MNKRLKDVLGDVVKIVEKGVYQDTGNRYCKISINGKKINHRFNSFVNPTIAGGYTDFQTKRFEVASDNYVKNNTIQICGIKFDVVEAISNNPKAKDKKYYAILKNGKKVGCFYNSQQKCVFYNVCI